MTVSYAFWTKNTGNSIAQRLTISSTGHVGVNTSDPIGTLHVNDIGTTGPAVHIVGGNADEGDITVPHTESFQLGHWNSSTNTFSERMRVHMTMVHYHLVLFRLKPRLYFLALLVQALTVLADTDNLLDMDTQGFITVENLDDTAGAEAGIILRAKTNFAGAWS